MIMVNSFQYNNIRVQLSQKYDLIKTLFKEMNSVLVAYSGGVDSALLLKIGTDILGDNCIGVLGVSSSLAADEKHMASKLAERINATLEILPTFEMENDLYLKNDFRRCFYCKHELFSRMRELAEQRNIAVIVDGSNADDRGDYRPGMEAAVDLQVRSPLLEADMNKEDIRQMARFLDLPIWDKPAQPCLSSRVMYGQLIKKDILDMIDRAEQYIKKRGYTVVRVRYLGSIASVEVDSSQLPRIQQQQESDLVRSTLKEIGFADVVIDPDGYRQGKLNENHATG
jgi:uncharacterized protein